MRAKASSGRIESPDPERLKPWTRIGDGEVEAFRPRL